MTNPVCCWNAYWRRRHWLCHYWVWCQKNSSNNSSLHPVSKKYLSVNCEQQLIRARVKSPRLTEPGEVKTPATRYAANKGCPSSACVIYSRRVASTGAEKSRQQECYVLILGSIGLLTLVSLVARKKNFLTFGYADDPCELESYRRPIKVSSGSLCSCDLVWTLLTSLRVQLSHLHDS